jgi:uncharacterized UPF0160 family protein
MDFFRKKLTVVTHNGNFHVDDVFGLATLKIWAERNNTELEIVRSRDQKVIESADVVLDVGNIFDPEKKRFDHHQNGGAGTHENGIPYASFGLIWKYYGDKLCSKEVWDIIENKLVIPVDARDNGINLSTPLVPGINEFRLHEVIKAFRPTWKDKTGANNGFEKATRFAKELLELEISNTTDFIEGENLVRQEIIRQEEPEVLILENDLPWEKPASENNKIKIVIYPEPDIEQWCIEAASNDPSIYGITRIFFPESWRGQREAELEKASGITGAIFCHRGGHFAVAKTKEVALEMAKKTLSGK